MPGVQTPLMVDFKKRLASKPVDFPTDPVEIYTRLDRASDKGPLRPAQTAVLSAWHAGPRSNKDVVLKLHTGEGKTLVELLVWHSERWPLRGGLVPARSSA